MAVTETRSTTSRLGSQLQGHRGCCQWSGPTPPQSHRDQRLSPAQDQTHPAKNLPVTLLLDLAQGPKMPGGKGEKRRIRFSETDEVREFKRARVEEEMDEQPSIGDGRCGASLRGSRPQSGPQSAHRAALALDQPRSAPAPRGTPWTAMKRRTTPQRCATA